MPHMYRKTILNYEILNLDYWSALPFTSLDDHVDEASTDGNVSYLNDLNESQNDDLTELVKQLEAGSNKDVKVTHLNVCSLRNKIDELRCLQFLCRFEVFAVKETHLNSSVSDTDISISIRDTRS